MNLFRKKGRLSADAGDGAIGVLLVGGSNTGIRNGWADHFERLATNCRVQNGFLGATGSLYGLINLMAISDLSKVDVVVFEYTLNDAIFMNYGVLDYELVRACLEQVAFFCRAKKVRLIFLMLNRRDDFPDISEHTQLINNAYNSVAKAWNLQVVSIREIISNRNSLASVPIDRMFDDHGIHLSEMLSLATAETVLSVIRCPHDVDGDLPVLTRESWINYVPATSADVHGATSFVDRGTAAFSGAFLKLGENARCHFSGSGRLIALLVNSRQESGWLTLMNSETAWAKNTHSSWTRAGTNRVIMQYMTRSLDFDGQGLTIVQGQKSEWVDFTPETLDPTVPDSDQTIELHGIVVLMAVRGEQDLAWCCQRLASTPGEYDQKSPPTRLPSCEPWWMVLRGKLSLSGLNRLLRSRRR